MEIAIALRVTATPLKFKRGMGRTSFFKESLFTQFKFLIMNRFMGAAVRVRFPPSPTGFLHIGGVRTALFNWLYARSRSGAFLLRIEDTDRERSLPQYTEDIMASLRWLGLEWDEEPLFQSQRFAYYQEQAKNLISKGQAYYCQCSPEELDKIRSDFAARKLPFRYPGICRDKARAAPGSVVRLKSLETGVVGYEDLIRGSLSVAAEDMDDWIILRRDGSPTYNFCVVLDDLEQKITHVLRGDDHINNTPKQVALYAMLGAVPPQFGHFPMILGPDRTKLSKRHGALSTLEYRTLGYWPEAVLNFLARLGWSHQNQEIFSRAELIQFFDLDKVGKSSAVFNLEKLNWVNQQHLKTAASDDVLAYLKQYFADKMPYLSSTQPEEVVLAIRKCQSKVKTLLELLDQLDCCFGAPPDFAAVAGGLTPEKKGQYSQILHDVYPVLEKNSFDPEELELAVRSFAKEHNLKFSDLAPALRYVAVGFRVSPGLFDLLSLQGRERYLNQYRNALAALT